MEKYRHPNSYTQLPPSAENSGWQGVKKDKVRRLRLSLAPGLQAEASLRHWLENERFQHSAKDKTGAL